MKNAVIVKSFQNGLILYLDKEIEFEELLEEAAAKFKESERFFKGCRRGGILCGTQPDSGRGNQAGGSHYG